MMRAKRPANQSISRSNARIAAIHSLIDDVKAFPRLAPRPSSFDLTDERDERLAAAIHLAVMRRWFTLRYVIDHFMDHRPFDSLDHAVRASLLAGAAQLMFLRRLPVHAVIDETVSAARPMIEPNAIGLINAVLRRISEHRGDMIDQPWQVDRQQVPCDDGHIALGRIMLPSLDDFPAFLEAACGIPEYLGNRWINAFGREKAAELAWHATQQPPSIISLADQSMTVGHEGLSPHDRPGCYVWQGGHEALRAMLASDKRIIVQDPTAAEPLRFLAEQPLKKVPLITDYCAGRGTKTRQLQAMFEHGRVIATDVDAARMNDLHGQFDGTENIDIIPIAELDGGAHRGKVDVLLLDVPCSNTGVLARRPEARYRFARNMLDRLVQLQRAIVRRSWPLLANDGLLIYSTCSIDAVENRKQVEWITREYELTVAHEQLTLPAGRGETYHDGGYFAAMRRE